MVNLMYLFLWHLDHFHIRFPLFLLGNKKRKLNYSNAMYFPSRRPSGLTESQKLRNNEVAFLRTDKASNSTGHLDHVLCQKSWPRSPIHQALSHPRGFAFSASPIHCHKELHLGQGAGMRLVRQWQRDRGLKERRAGISVCLFILHLHKKTPICKAHHHVRLQSVWKVKHIVLKFNSPPCLIKLDPKFLKDRAQILCMFGSTAAGTIQLLPSICQTK